MPSTKVIKQRIRSTKSTAQITKAMEVVSATKMRKSQEFALRARPYALASLEMLKNLLARTPALPLLLQKREINNSALLVVTSDKGLAGAFNAGVLKKAENWIAQKKSAQNPFRLITVGKKARDYFLKQEKAAMLASFWGFGDYSGLGETQPVADIILREFLQNKFDETDAVYTNFRTTLLQETVVKKILPISKEGIEEVAREILPEQGKFAILPSEPHLQDIYSYEYKYEPSAEEILSELVPQLIRMYIHHIILESNASEHSARMVAMKNASDNAKELIGSLTLAYNKARQAQITGELIEITAGKEALEQ